MDLARNQFILEDLITPHTYVAAENAGEFRFLKVGPFATQDAWQNMLLNKKVKRITPNDTEAFSSLKTFQNENCSQYFICTKSRVG